MSLELHFHPFASYCQKALVALYENDTPFTPCFVDLGDEAVRARFKAMWPIGKMPVLRDTARDRTIPEATIVIEYLAQHYPGRTVLVPRDVDLAIETRLRDRFYDLYVQDPMQRIVGDRLRPVDKRDPYGAPQAKASLLTAYDVIEREMRSRTWAIGDLFTMADCAAAPALYYANLVLPFGDAHPNVAAYFQRLMERPSFARVVEEAVPYRALFPEENPRS